MDTYSLAEAARDLGTTVPRVQRAIEATGLHPHRSPRGRRLDRSQVEVLKAKLGSVPHVEGFRREDLLVLAALSRRPCGLRSARAVARAASVSPTTATAVLARLTERGLVAQRSVRTVEGQAVDVALFEVAWGAQWFEVAPIVRSVIIPEVPRRAPAQRLPARLWHHFWNGDPASIRLPEDEDYVAGRLLRSQDPQALAWASTHLSAGAIERAALLRGTSRRDRWWLHQLAAGAA